MMKNRKWISIILTGMLMAFTVLLSMPPSKAEAAEPTARTPVVFVHGLSGSDSNFAYIKYYLQKQGWTSDELYAIDLPSKQGNQLLNSAAIASFVDDVLSKTGHTKVNIVAHSMGGANSLYYILNRDGASKVDKLITLGGANRLTTSDAPAGVNVTSIYSTSDTIVANYLSILNGANNIRISGVSHIGLIFSSQVNQLIQTALEE
ncbi:alpha/beta fold hydrolase [Paenibacillus mucilaginosus]|uniref:EstA n=2 Tax=Paenibacillus mucilaginosus TaxID=61624 RepID=F8FBS6_PAEMK|nr:EstA [Paenibacillus mucilaginosus KNP414]MCG7212304.1 alpha/beta fold hydrolase [Paenibacillus mucilaginosus]WDM24735.1 alpha/beta fold hydrolase [Paenibacillus mucilaginosus]